MDLIIIVTVPAVNIEQVAEAFKSVYGFPVDEQTKLPLHTKEEWIALKITDFVNTVNGQCEFDKVKETIREAAQGLVNVQVTT